jgi:hypothetical protein
MRSLLVLAGLGALGVGAFATIGYAAPNGTAAQQQYAPSNTVAPSISGNAVENQRLTASDGTWTGDGPISFAYQWVQCNTTGASCSSIARATGKTYTVQTADVGRTLRVTVTASNRDGRRSVTSGATGVVASAAPAGAIRLSNGETSIPVTSVALPHRLVVTDVQFSPNPVRVRSTGPVTIRAKVKDTRGFVVRGALVFARSTPEVTSTPPEQLTQQDGWVTLTSVPQADFPRNPAYNVQVFLRARKPGEDGLAGVSGRRLTQFSLSR